MEEDYYEHLGAETEEDVAGVEVRGWGEAEEPVEDYECSEEHGEFVDFGCGQLCVMLGVIGGLKGRDLPICVAYLRDPWKSEEPMPRMMSAM